jgi:hypothetical protein
MLLICNQSLNYIFYLEFSVRASMVKLEIVAEEMFCFAVLHDKLHDDSCCGLQGFVLVCVLHFIFGLLLNFRRSYKIPIIPSKE